MMHALLAAATIPTPSPAQLRYMATDFIALIHFNMGTFAHNGDPCCDATNWSGTATSRVEPSCSMLSSSPAATPSGQTTASVVMMVNFLLALGSGCVGGAAAQLGYLS